MSMPGYGDQITWPAYDGDPNDPRHEDDDDEEFPEQDVVLDELQVLLQ